MARKRVVATAGVIRVVVAVSVGLLLAAVAGCGASDIVIGALVTTSNSQGPAADGIEFMRGIDLAVEEINEAGGINGSQILIHHVNVQASGDQAAEALQSSEDDEQPLLYISTLSAVTQVVAPVAESAGAPLVASMASAPGITDGMDWVFRFWPQLSDEIEPTLRLIERIEPSSVALVYSNEPYGQSFFPSFAEPFRRLNVGLSPVPFDPSAPSVEVDLSLITDHDAVFVVGWPTHLSELIPAIRAYGYNGTIITTNAMSLPGLRRTRGMEGAYLIAPGLYNPSLPYSGHFLRMYETSYGEPSNHQAGSGYDLIHLVANLLEDQEVTRENLRRQFEAGFVYPGVNGTVEVEAGAHDFSFPFFPARIVEGNITYL